MAASGPGRFEMREQLRHQLAVRALDDQVDVGEARDVGAEAVAAGALVAGDLEPVGDR
jgi:hypothetical protein